MIGTRRGRSAPGFAPVLAAVALVLSVTTTLLPSAVASDPSRHLLRPARIELARIELGGVRVRLAPGTTQVVTARHTAGYHAVVALWSRTGDPYDGGGRWVRRMVARDGRIGYGGLVVGTRRVQGTGTTPVGTYRLISSFGTHPRNAAWQLPYRRIRPGDFWDEDNGSRFYNRYRNQAQGGFRWWLPVTRMNGSERLSDYPVPYEFSIVTSFNVGQVRHRGAGIFLHVNGDGATAGCVSAPRWFIVSLMSRLRPERVPVIAIGN